MLNFITSDFILCISSSVLLSFCAGMDKILVSSDGEVCVSNDGATILERMEVENEIAKV